MEDTPIPVVNEDDEETISLTPEGEETATDVTSETITVIDQNDYEELDNLPQVNGVELKGNKTNSELGIPTKTSQLQNDSGFITNAPVTSVNGETGDVTVDVPTKTSDLTNDSGFITGYTETDPTVPSWAKQATKPTYDYSEITNTPTIPEEMVMLSYGHSTWQDFIGAYNDNRVIYCKASSNSDPSTGAQNRMAFMAYVSSANSPTSVEFQYVRSVRDKSASQQCDQVFIYTLTNANGGTWSVTTRDMNARIATGTNMTSSYSNGVLTLNATQPTVPTKTSDLTNDSGFITSSSLPTKTSDLTNDGSDSTSTYLEADETAYRTAAIPYGECDDTSTATVFTATVPGITELRDGVCMWLKNGIVTSASGFTINVNNLGAKPAYSNMAAASRETTLWNIAYTMLFVYDSTRVEGGCWVLYRGYDSNTNTIGYQIRTNSQTMPVTDKFYRYRMLFTSADGTHYVPANTSTSTNATSTKAANQKPINPFGSMFYYGATGAVNAEANPSATNMWQQYAFSLGYSFNTTGAALALTSFKPVYLKCAPQTDGSAIIDSTEPYVQDLPTTNDGKIYIFLGKAYSATNIELEIVHPVYYHNGTGIRLWTGGA